MVTFKMKRQEPKRRGPWSAQEVAQEIGVHPHYVLDALKELGEYVDSMRKKCLWEPVVRKVYGLLDFPYKEPTPPPVSPWQIRDTGDPSPAPQRRPRLRPQVIPRTKFETSDRSLGLGDPSHDVDVTWSVQSWRFLGFSEIERDAWIAHGLRDTQAKSAAEFRDAGICPGDLGTDLGGWTAARRLKQGEPPSMVADKLARKRNGEKTG